MGNLIKILFYLLVTYLTIILFFSSVRSESLSDRTYFFLTTSDDLISINRTSLTKINKIDNEAFTDSWVEVIELSEIASLSSGKGVTVAVIDSGIDTRNPLFESITLSSSWNFAENSNIIMDQNGHGTNVCGIVRQFVPDANLMVLKINHADSNTFYNKTVVDAIYYAVENGAEIINMSLSLSKESNDVKDALYYAIEQGVIVVSAAGNNSSVVSFPGSINDVITVAATTSDGASILWNSPEGSAVDIAAPGKYVQTVALDGEIVFVTGSSFSTAMVSGTIAALIGMNQYLKPSTIEHLIFSSAKDIGTIGKDSQFGWGLLNGSGIKKAAAPSIRVKKVLSSTEKLTTTNSLPSNSFEISCYLPPTDIYADAYIALVKYKNSNAKEIDDVRLNIDSIWWLDSNGIWREHNNAGMISIGSLAVDSVGVDILLFSNLGGVWENFSSVGFKYGNYRFGIALMRDFKLVAPIFWSPIVIF